MLLLWVNNHFTDFETDPAMMEHLERFEASLEEEKMQVRAKQLHVLIISVRPAPVQSNLDVTKWSVTSIPFVTGWARKIVAKFEVKRW